MKKSISNMDDYSELMMKQLHTLRHFERCLFVAELLHQLTLFDGLILHDSVSDRSADSSDDIGVSINGTAVKFTMK